MSAPSATGESIVQELWNEQAAWSAAADAMKRTRQVLRTCALVLTVAGALLQTLAGALPDQKRLIGGAGAICLALVPFLTARFLGPERTRKWLRARSISEAMKSEIFTFLAGADPYRGDDGLKKLHQKVREIRDSGQDLEADVAAVNPPVTQAPPLADAEGYLKRRVDEQISQFYRPKARFNARRAIQFHWAETVLAAVAAVLGGYASFAASKAFGPWVAVLTTVGGTLAAHAAASRYDFQAGTYFATARRLEDLSRDWKLSQKAAPSDAWSEFVRACEAVMSAENRGWMAKLDSKE